MSNLQYFTYKGLGEWAAEHLGYSQAVRVGDILYLSGQGGWNSDAEVPVFEADINKQIDQAFKNVERALLAAGGERWSQVFRVNSYHVFLTPEATAAMIRNFKKYMPDHKPIWTEIGVAQLGADGMDVEIEVQAYAPKTAET
ncbi:hypothetical protein IAT40_003302 [Kwoniella sp. CBS 6097]